MKTIFKPIGCALAMLLVLPGVSFGLSIETSQPVVSKPEASIILVADNDDDRPFWWRYEKPAWQGDDDWDDDDDDRWDDDDGDD